jgi:hypothetical protein
MPNELEPKTDIEVMLVQRTGTETFRPVNTFPFSENSYSLLKTKIASYVSELVRESIKISKRHHADNVSAAHVEQASEYLVSSSSKKLFRHLGTLGGILLGAAISNLLAMTIANQYTAPSSVHS